MKKIAIVGGSPTSQMLAPFDDPEWQIWVLGNQLSCYAGQSVNWVFEIHDDLSDKPAEYPDWLLKCAPRLMVTEQFPLEDEKIHRYPRDKVEALIGGHLSSSIAYMIGYAILEGATDIAIYGVDMSVDNHEYFKQRPDMYAWIGYAMGQGIAVTIPDETPLFKSTYDEGKHWGKPSRGRPPFTEGELLAIADSHQAKILECQDQVIRLREEAEMHKGCRDAYKQMAKVARAIEGGAQINKLTDVTWHGD